MAVMRRLLVFNMVSLDGYFTDAQGDMSWAHRHDPEWQAFGGENAAHEATFLFGRVTYEMMASWWPTPQALAANRVIAERMNGQQKIVFSHTLHEARWQNSTLVKGDLVKAVRTLKSEDGPGLVIMGSGSIVARLSDARLIDEYQLVVVPVALGAGRTLFEGMKTRLDLRLTRTRAFGNGNVVLWYEP
jgi:dihydrofolate reductase